MKSRLPKCRMRLSVQNPSGLSIGNAPSHVFDALGGSVGSSAVCTWRLEAPGRRIAGLHMEIGYQEGQFVVVDTCGATFLKGMRDPLGRGRVVGLVEGVCLQIGPYELVVSLLSDNDWRSAEPLGQLENIDDLLEKWGKMGCSPLGTESRFP